MTNRITLNEIDRRGRPTVVEVVLHDLGGVQNWKISLHVEEDQYILSSPEGRDMVFEVKEEAIAFCRNHFSDVNIVGVPASR